MQDLLAETTLRPGEHGTWVVLATNRHTPGLAQLGDLVVGHFGDEWRLFVEVLLDGQVGDLGVVHGLCLKSAARSYRENLALDLLLQFLQRGHFRVVVHVLLDVVVLLGVIRSVLNNHFRIAQTVIDHLLRLGFLLLLLFLFSL